MVFEDLDKPTIPPVPIVPSAKFDLSPASPSGSIVAMIAGEKGSGKTVMSFNPIYFPGKVVVLSFDRKSVLTKKHFMNNDERIEVYDAVRYLDPSYNMYTETSALTIEYIKTILAKYEKEPVDWLVIDGLGEFSNIAEMAMRKQHGLNPYDGISNRNMWKTRRAIMRSIHLLACKYARRGVIYTAYTESDNDVREGDIYTSKKVPKWTDIVLMETDVEIYVYQKQSPTDETKFYAKIVSSKIPMFKTGEVLDVTRR